MQHKISRYIFECGISKVLAQPNAVYIYYYSLLACAVLQWAQFMMIESETNINKQKETWNEKNSPKKKNVTKSGIECIKDRCRVVIIWRVRVQIEIKPFDYWLSNFLSRGMKIEIPLIKHSLNRFFSALTVLLSTHLSCVWLSV